MLLMNYIVRNRNKVCCQWFVCLCVRGYIMCVRVCMCKEGREGEEGANFVWWIYNPEIANRTAEHYVIFHWC